MTAQTRPYITPEEYLERERTAATKSEYYGGEVFAMAGASWAHNMIVSNFVGELHSQLKGGPCKVLSSDLKVRIGQDTAFVYPDVVGLCSGPEFDQSQRDVILNPELVVEVLSPSTQDNDRGGKRILYQSIPTLKEYVLVAQNRPHIEHYVRQTEIYWQSRFYTDLAESIELASMNCSLTLADIYAGVDFSA